MDLVSKSYSNTIRVSQRALSPITTPGNSILGSRSHSSDTSFPIIAIAVIGILATGFLLVSYYIFVIKCCLNRHRVSLSRTRPVDGLTAAVEHRGLDVSVIRSIIFRFKKNNEQNNNGEDDECPVCLNEFIEDGKLRRIPNCSHVSTSIASMSISKPIQIVHFAETAFQSTPSMAMPPRDPSSTINGDEEDYVVIELSNNNNTSSIDELSTRKKKARMLQKGTSLGDEWIDIRDKNQEFCRDSANKEIDLDGFICRSAAVFSSSRSYKTKEASQ